MTKVRGAAALTVTMVFAVFAVVAQAKAGKTSYPAYNATSTINNADSSGAAALLQSDNLAGTGATYCATSSTNPPCAAASGVSSFVGGSTGEWQLDLSQQTYRVVYLNFGVASPNPGSSVIAIPSGYYNATIFSRCYDQGGNLVSLLSIAAGTSNNNCSLRINFTYSGTTYSFVMAPAPELPTGAPATGRASVACTAAATDGSGCASWTITPSTVSANPGYADLIQHTTRSQIVLGSYSGDRFQINLQR